MTPLERLSGGLSGFSRNLQSLPGTRASNLPPPPLHNTTARSNPDQQCGFMRLPPEIRNFIYAYLLSTIHTSNVPSNARSWLPDVSTNIQIAILRVSRQIKREAEDVLGRKNSLVLVTSNLIPCEQWRVFAQGAVIMKGQEAKDFYGHALEIELDTSCYSTISSKGRHLCVWDRPRYYLVAGEDLAKVVRALLIIHQTATGSERTLLTQCHITINSLIPFDQEACDDGTLSITDVGELRKLLDPLRRLHSVARASVNGPVPIAYKNELIADMCGSHIECDTMLDLVTTLEARGDAFTGAGEYQRAYQTYRAAVICVHGHQGIRAWTLFGSFRAHTILYGSTVNVRTKREIARHWLTNSQTRASFGEAHTLTPKKKELWDVGLIYHDALEHQSRRWQKFQEIWTTLWPRWRDGDEDDWRSTSRWSV